LTAIQFSQTVYFHRAKKMGLISPHQKSKLNPRSREFTPRAGVTIIGSRRGAKQARPPRPKEIENKVDTAMAYPTQNSPRKKELREWEWIEGEMEPEAKVLRDLEQTQPVKKNIGAEKLGDAEDKGASLASGDESTQPSASAEEEMPQNKDSVEGEDDIHGNGAKDMAPRGKSWMLVTERLMQGYYIELSA
jgi:hypothetical protein